MRSFSAGLFNEKSLPMVRCADHNGSKSPQREYEKIFLLISYFLIKWKSIFWVMVKCYLNYSESAGKCFHSGIKSINLYCCANNSKRSHLMPEHAAKDSFCQTVFDPGIWKETCAPWPRLYIHAISVPFLAPEDESREKSGDFTL